MHYALPNVVGRYFVQLHPTTIPHRHQLPPDILRQVFTSDNQIANFTPRCTTRRTTRRKLLISPVFFELLCSYWEH